MGKKSSQKKKQRRQPAQPVSQEMPAARSLPSLGGTPVAAAQPLAVRPGKPVAADLAGVTALVRTDIRRVILTLLVILAVLAGLFVLNRQSDLLRRAGRTVANFMKLS